LRVVGLWWEPGFDPLAEPGFATQLAAALVAHRDFADLERVDLPSGARHHALGVATRAAIRAIDAERGVKRPRRAAVGPSRRTTRQPPSRRRNRHEEAPDG
jgi:hypothetical protein